MTSHILDTSLGRPAADVRVELQRLQSSGQWLRVNEGRTNADGRVASHLVPEAETFEAGAYRMVFYTQEYFERNGVSEFFYPEVTIAFIVKDPRSTTTCRCSSTPSGTRPTAEAERWSTRGKF